MISLYRIGIDLGGTNIAIGLVNDEGKLLRKKSIPTLRERGHKLILDDMAKTTLQFINDIDMSEIESLGVGSPGKCDSENKIIIYSCNIGFDNTNIAEELGKHFKFPIKLENDAKCAALAESICGAAKDYKNSITVTFGTGIGGGIIINDKLLTHGGEIGHHAIIINGEQCTCGRKGCWEAYASATALVRQARDTLKSKTLGAKDVFDLANMNDSSAKQVVDNYFDYVAEGIANLINIFAPDVIVVGGGISAQGDNFITPIKKRLQHLVYGGELVTEIVTAKLGNDAGIIGAALL